MALEEEVQRDEIGVLLQRVSSDVAEDRLSGSCSSSSSSSAAVAEAEAEMEKTHSGNGSKCRVDRMVKIELDAARALADFAHLVRLESENPSGESGGKWGNKGRRSRKRIKSEPPARDLGSVKFQYSKDDTMLDQRHHTQNAIIETVERVKVEQDTGIPRSNAILSTGCASFVRGRSKRNLTEAEKEARRLRRVLANRESARQTIRRRQAMCEELTRKADDLARANENMKREKDLAVKEYKLLKERNEQLKSRIAKKVKAAVQGTPEETASTHVEIPAPSASELPFLIYNGLPFPPFICPSIIQAFNPVQMQPVHATMLQDQVHPISSHEQGNTPFPNEPRTPFYLLPCPWYFPLPDHRNHPQPHPMASSGSRDKQEDASNNDQRDGESSKEILNVDSNNPSLNMEVKIDVSSSTEANSGNNPPEIEFPTAGGQTLGPYPQGAIHMPSLHRCTRRASAAKGEKEVHPHSTCTDEPVSSTASHAASPLREKIHAPTMHSSKRLVDVAVAAAARKRRKELTKQKNLCEKEVHLLSTCADEPVSSTASHVASPSQEKMPVPTMHSSSRLVDAAVAAEARKKRKELTKRKNLLCKKEVRPHSTCADEPVFSTASHVASPSGEEMHAPTMHLSKSLVDVAVAAEARMRRKELTKQKNLCKKEVHVHPHSTCAEEPVFSTVSHVASPSQEEMHVLTMYSSRRLVDAAVAAEAQKRRKELTREKSHCEKEVHPHSACGDEPVSSIASHVASPVREKMHAPTMHLSKRLVDAAIAAVARKRRKELTKLKNRSEKEVHPHSICADEPLSSTASHVASPLQEKMHAPVRLVDAAVAALARKRRKELTKQKNLHGRQEKVHVPTRLVDAAVAAVARKRRKELTKQKNLHGRQLRLHC